MLYYLFVNVLSLLMFALDKRQAVNNGWRIPERHLLLCAVAGGWPAGFIAMQVFRHKRRKTAFLLRWILALLIHLVIVMAYLRMALFS